MSSLILGNMCPQAVLQADSAALAAHFFGKADAKRMTSALRDGRGLLAGEPHP